MSSRALPPPRLPEAPEEYTRAYMEDLVRALDNYIQQERNPGEMRGTKITLTAITYKSHRIGIRFTVE